MIFNKLFIIFVGVILTTSARSQTACSVLGQSPVTAFPVCGTATFKQDSVPLCGGRNVPTRCTDGSAYADTNPFWYKFTCYSTGTFSFLITPNTSSDDYDWQLFDITGHNPNDIYTTPGLIISGNWSSNPGPTGAVSGASGSVNCAGPAYSNQNEMPTLQQGHDYLLMVSHYTSTQSGYSLSFTGGGTASITNEVPPAIQEIQAICYGSELRVIMNKRMQCSSLAADGSDFTVTPAVSGLKVIGVFSTDCSSGFDMDTVILVFNEPLPLGSHSIGVKIGSDGNTLLDNCGNQIPPGQSVPFIMAAPQPTPMDDMAPLSCAPDVLQLIFKKKIQCSSIASDGSDFIVTGTSPVTVIGASGNCDTADLSSVILVKLSSPIETAGNFQLTLRTGGDGNTLLDECGLTTPPASLSFSTLDTVSAAIFTDQIKLGCRYDTIVYDYPSKNGVNQWQWVFDGGDTSLLQDPPQRIYSAFGQKTVRLVVSNGFCSDTTQATPLLDNAIDAKFEAPVILCPKDYASFKNNSTGELNTWNWDFGDGFSNNQQVPADHLYPLTGIETNYTVQLIVGNELGCYDTATQKIDVLKSCYIAVPSAFTPNGDGLNDYLYPLNAFNADNLVFRVYNRTGEMVFQSNDWTSKWDGTIHGHPEPAGTYVWYLQYIDRDTGKRFFQKGTTILIR